MFTSSNQLLRCFHVGALQILLELRANCITPLQSSNQGIKQDIIRDGILSPFKFNSKSFYSHITFSRFGGKEFSGVEKFARRGMEVSRADIVAAMVRCNIAIGSHRSTKCAMEISLCAMRSQYHIAKYENTRRQLCKICFFLNPSHTFTSTCLLIVPSLNSSGRWLTDKL